MPGRRALLIVGPESGTRQVLVEQLSRQPEFEVSHIETANLAKDGALAGRLELLIMGIQPPGEQAIEAIADLRARNFKAPIIVISTNEDDGLKALNAGAGDYIVTPLRFAVLLARIRAQLRHYDASENAVFPLGSFSFRPAAKLLVDSRGEKIKLTDKETAILRYLYRRNEKPTSRDVLLEEIWGYNSGVSTHTLETHIYRLRQKIETDPSNATLLVTEVGGYRLVP